MTSRKVFRAGMLAIEVEEVPEINHLEHFIVINDEYYVDLGDLQLLFTELLRLRLIKAEN